MILEKLSAVSKDFMQKHYQQESATGSNLKVVYTKLLEYQRTWLWELNKDINYDEEVIRKLLLVIDMEEEKLRIIYT